MRVGAITGQKLVRILVRTILSLAALMLVLVASWEAFSLIYPCGILSSGTFRSCPYQPSLFGPAPRELSPDDYLRRSLVETIPELQWTPDGTGIVFAFTDRRSRGRLERRLYVLASDGSKMLPVTSSNETVFSPTLSPDSSRVAYSTDMGGYRIEVSSLDGLDRRRFTNEAERAVSPVWSPDGDRIAFVGGGTRRVFLFFTRSTDGIYTVSADGADIRKVVDAGAEEDGLEYLGGLSWSSDGQFLAFWGRDNDVHVRNQAAIYMVKADGSGLTPLFSTSVRSSTRPTEVSFLAWSPDGRRIAFLRDVDGLPKLYTVGLDGLEPRVIASPDVEYRARWTSGGISWSPDSTRILFSLGSLDEDDHILYGHADWGYYPPATGTLYIVNPDGSDLRTIGRGIYSAWSPDGTRIANVVPSDHEAVLYTIDPDGSDVRVSGEKGARWLTASCGPRTETLRGRRLVLCGGGSAGAAGKPRPRAGL